MIGSLQFWRSTWQYFVLNFLEVVRLIFSVMTVIFWYQWAAIVVNWIWHSVWVILFWLLQYCLAFDVIFQLHTLSIWFEIVPERWLEVVRIFMLEAVFYVRIGLWFQMVGWPTPVFILFQSILMSQLTSPIWPQLRFLSQVRQRFSVGKVHQINWRIVPFQVADVVSFLFMYFTLEIGIIARKRSLLSAWMFLDRTEVVLMLVGVRVLNRRLNWTQYFLFLSFVFVILLMDYFVDFIELTFYFVRKGRFWFNCRTAKYIILSLELTFLASTSTL